MSDGVGQVMKRNHQSKLCCQYSFESDIHWWLTPNSPSLRRFSYASFAIGLSFSSVLKSRSFCSSMWSSNGVGFWLAPAGTLLNGFDDVIAICVLLLWN